MKPMNMLGVAAVAAVVVLVTGAALNAFAGPSTASDYGSRDRGRHHGSQVEYDSDVTQECDVYIELSEVRRSGVCTPEADVSQSGSAHGRHGADVKYESDVTQKCNVYIEMSEVKDSDVCTPEATVKQGSGASGGSSGGSTNPSSGGGHGGHDHDGGRHHSPSVDIENTEKTTCLAEGQIALNQCDVGGDANAFVQEDEPNGHTAGVAYESWSGHRYSKGDVTIENTEKTTCYAEGVIALNQCDVDGDANAFGGGLLRGLPLLGSAPTSTLGTLLG